MNAVASKWKVRIVVLRKKITLSTLIEAGSLYLVFIGISHFSNALAFIAIGVFGIWVTESGNS